MNRVSILIVAAVVAIGSCLGLVKYASGAEDRAVEASKPVSVLVASKDIPAGTPFSTAWNDHRIGTSQTLQSLLPATAVRDPKALQGLVATSALAQGQFVVSGAFADPAAAGKTGPPTFATDLPRRHGGRLLQGGRAAGGVGPRAPGRSRQPARAGAERFGARVCLTPVARPSSTSSRISRSSPSATSPRPRRTRRRRRRIRAPGSTRWRCAPEDSARLLLLSNEYDVYLTLVGPKTAPGDIPPIADRDGLPALTPHPACTTHEPAAGNGSSTRPRSTASRRSRSMTDRRGQLGGGGAATGAPAAAAARNAIVCPPTCTSRCTARSSASSARCSTTTPSTEKELEQRLHEAIVAAFTENGAPLNGAALRTVRAGRPQRRHRLRTDRGVPRRRVASPRSWSTARTSSSSSARARSSKCRPDSSTASTSAA